MKSSWLALAATWLSSFGTGDAFTPSCGRRREVTQRTSSSTLLAAADANSYDQWRSDAVVDTMVLDENNIETCLEEFVQSEYGTTMFGCHERAAAIGISGSIRFVELAGPCVTLSLAGRFWHRRETVLGRAAMWLHARMPELTNVVVGDPDELLDYENELDEFGDVLFQKDKKSPDFNGDRAAMEYQGRDPDMRGPFPPGATSLTINPM